MNLEDQVVSRELALSMRAAGFPQHSYFYHVCDTVYGTGIAPNPTHDLLENARVCVCVSAYAVAELGEWLPDCIVDRKGCVLHLDIDKDRHQEGFRWHLGYGDDIFDGANEANARALVLLWLAENGHINPKEMACP